MEIRKREHNNYLWKVIPEGKLIRWDMNKTEKGREIILVVCLFFSLTFGLISHSTINMFTYQRHI